MSQQAKAAMLKYDEIDRDESDGRFLQENGKSEVPISKYLHLWCQKFFPPGVTANATLVRIFFTSETVKAARRVGAALATLEKADAHSQKVTLSHYVVTTPEEDSQHGRQIFEGVMGAGGQDWPSSAEIEKYRKEMCNIAVGDADVEAAPDDSGDEGHEADDVDGDRSGDAVVPLGGGSASSGAAAESGPDADAASQVLDELAVAQVTPAVAGSGQQLPEVEVSEDELSSVDPEDQVLKNEGPGEVRTRMPLSPQAKAWVLKRHARYWESSPPELSNSGVAGRKYFQKLTKRGMKKGLMPNTQKPGSVRTFVNQVVNPPAAKKIKVEHA